MLKETTLKFGPLDEIRGLAAIAVFLIHYIQLYFKTKDFGGIGVVADLLGVWGVSIFFILSGFLIHTATLGEYAKAQFVSWKKYALRRFFRIYPPYFACLIASTGISYYYQSNMITKPDIGNVLTHVFMLSTYFPEHFESLNAIFWTVIVEVHFYVFYPFLFFLIQKHSAIKLFSASLIVGLIYFFTSVLLTQPGLARIMHQHTPISLFWKWMLRVVLAELYRQRRPVALVRFLTSVPIMLVAIMLSFLPVAFMPHNLVLQYERFVLPFLSFVFFGGLLFSPANRIQIKPLVMMGQISYSFYLWHPLVLLGLSFAFPAASILSFGVAVLASIFVAWLSYELTEKTSMSLGKVILSSSKHAPRSVPVAS